MHLSHDLDSGDPIRCGVIGSSESGRHFIPHAWHLAANYILMRPVRASHMFPTTDSTGSPA